MPRKMKLSPEGLAHIHRVAMHTLRISFPGQRCYRDAILAVYMVEECLGRQTPTVGDSVRRRWPKEKFVELKQ